MKKRALNRREGAARRGAGLKLASCATNLMIASAIGMTGAVTDVAAHEYNAQHADAAARSTTSNSARSTTSNSAQGATSTSRASAATTTAATTTTTSSNLLSPSQTPTAASSSSSSTQTVSGGS